jgi:UDP-N-acetylglucosamine/UDP-N-acetylgalactosamine diphosphorylase
MHPIIDSFQKAGQGHVFAFFDQLTSEGQSRLLAEAGEIDLAEVERLNRTLVATSAAVGVDLEGLAPAPYEPLPVHGGKRRRLARGQAGRRRGAEGGTGGGVHRGRRAGDPPRL